MKIAIGGDISVTAGCKTLFAERKTKKLFGDVPEAFKDCDRVIVNLECALTEEDKVIKKFGAGLKAPLETAKILKEVGVTDCALSNNHIFDFGKKGLSDTIAALEKNEINYTGVGENCFDARKDLFIAGDQKVAVIAVCEHEYSYALSDRVGAREYDVYDTMDDIMEAKKTADYVIVLYHGGKEHVQYPSPRLLKACRSMIKHGADVVLCQHSHCIGCYEQYMGGHILYGQGNFHFIYTELGHRDPEKWNNGLIVVLDLKDSCRIELIPTVVDGTGIRLARAEEKEQILEKLAERSKSLQDGTWKEYWHDFCVENYENYSQSIKPEAIELFAHYLDCEAHSDVWRELFPTWNMTNEK